LILLGDPASGKDTQAKLLISKYALKAVESGKHWRAMAKKNNAEGAWLRRTMSLGGPTPVPLMKKFLKNQIEHAPHDKNLIFVGNPRLKPEAQLLKKLLDQQHKDFFVIFLKLPKKEIFKRAQARLSAHDRADDSKMQYIKKRISWQDPKTSKAVKYFESLHKLKFINGNQSIRKVYKDIIKSLKGFKKVASLRAAALYTKG